MKKPWQGMLMIAGGVALACTENRINHNSFFPTGMCPPDIALFHCAFSYKAGFSAFKWSAEWTREKVNLHDWATAARLSMGLFVSYAQ